MQAASCAICISLLERTDDVMTTICGHVFHMPCLQQWLERNRTCPQCREKLSSSKYFRLYFNFSNDTSIKEDATSLQHRVDNMQFQLDLKDVTIRETEKKHQEMLKQANLLRKEVKHLEKRIGEKESAICAFKNQVQHFKGLASESDTYKAKFESLQNRVALLESIERLVTGTKDDADEVIATHDANSLGVYVATLKKQLDVEAQRRRETRNQLRAAKTELKKLEEEKELALSSKLALEREVESLNQENAELQRLLSQPKSENAEDGAWGGEPAEAVEPLRPKKTIKRSPPKLQTSSGSEDEENSPLLSQKRFKVKNLRDEYNDKNAKALPANSILKKRPRLANDPTARTTAIDDRYVPDGLGGFMKNEQFPRTNHSRRISPPVKKTAVRKGEKFDVAKNQKIDAFIDLT